MLDEVKRTHMNAYEIKTGLSRSRISHLMDAKAGSMQKKAVELGFADNPVFFLKRTRREEEKSWKWKQVMFSEKR